MVNSRRWPLIIVLFIALAGVIASCDSGNSSPTPTSGPTNSDAELVKQAGTNMKALKSYHVAATGSMSGGDVKISGDIDLADNTSQLDMSVGGQDLQTIQIGLDTYASTDGGKTFTKSPAGGAGIGDFVRIWDSFNPASIDQHAANFKDGNPAHETIAGGDTRHVTATASDLSLTTGGANSTVDLWITTDASPLVSQMRVTGQSGSQGVNLTFNWSHFNQNLDIKAPLPMQTTPPPPNK